MNLASCSCLLKLQRSIYRLCTSCWRDQIRHTYLCTFSAVLLYLTLITYIHSVFYDKHGNLYVSVTHLANLTDFYRAAWNADALHGCRRGLAMRMLSICLSVRLSSTWIVTKQKNNFMQIFIPYERSFCLVF